MRRSLQQSKRLAAQHGPARSQQFTCSARLLRTPQATKPEGKVLRLETINPSILNVQYAVRGAIPQEADKLERKLKTEGSKAAEHLGFDQVIYANIGKYVHLFYASACTLDVDEWSPAALNNWVKRA